jgi:hypothetical protein
VKIDGKWYNIDTTCDDPVGNSFSDHSANNYSYFLLSDSDMNKNHYPDTTKHTCSAASIGNKAFEYGCPWMNLDNFMKTEAELEAAIKKALEEKTSSYFMKWSFSANDWKKYEMFTSEQDVKDYLIAWKNEDNTSWASQYFYITTNSIDEAKIHEWALLNGVQASYSCGQDPIMDGYYYGQVSIQACGYDIYTSLENLGANIQKAYDNGKTEYTFLYDYRGTGLSSNEAKYAIINASVGYEMLNGHSVLDESTEGLMLFCHYYR